MPARKHDLCGVDDIPVGASRGFSITTPAGPEDIFLVRTATAVVGYLNHCPHTGGPLDWVPDQFLNPEGDLVQCATHHALFRIEDGLCIQGPCAGRSLTPVTLEVTGNRIWAVPDASR
jgi:nitrite reductase/ring-hydroxylating ferredoxin subunit